MDAGGNVHRKQAWIDLYREIQEKHPEMFGKKADSEPEDAHWILTKWDVIQCWN